MTIERKSLRAQIREELLDRMRSGVAAPGESINEVQLAAELGVSRTPLREALIALETEGQIVSQSGKGFAFVPFSTHELEELGPIIAALECLALDLTPVEELRQLGEELARLAAGFTENVAEHALIVRRDNEWHGVMLSKCPNSRLMEMITGVRLAVHRYESLLVSDEAMVQRSSEEHAEIARHLIDGKVAKAKKALTTNWLNGVHRTLTARAPA